MSYTKIIGNKEVTFRDEESYLEARLEKLRLYPDIPFIGFLENGIYDTSKCQIEMIQWEKSSETPSAASIAEALWDTTDNYISGSDIGGSYSSSSYYYSHFSTEPVAHPIEGQSYMDSSTGMWNYYVNGEWIPSDLHMFSADGHVDGIEPKAVPKKNKKEEPPDDPIEDRFGILDL